MMRWSYVLVIVITLLKPSWAIVSAVETANSGGYPMAPTATIVPWPAMSRGTEATVPKPPGLVSVTVPPEKSSGISWLLRAFSTITSYATWNSA